MWCCERRREAARGADGEGEHWRDADDADDADGAFAREWVAVLSSAGTVVVGEGEDSSDSACTGHSSFVKRARAENRARPLYPLCFLAFFRTADDCLYEAHRQISLKARLRTQNASPQLSQRACAQTARVVTVTATITGPGPDGEIDLRRAGPPLNLPAPTAWANQQTYPPVTSRDMLQCVHFWPYYVILHFNFVMLPIRNAVMPRSLASQPLPLALPCSAHAKQRPPCLMIPVDGLTAYHKAGPDGRQRYSSYHICSAVQVGGQPARSIRRS